MKNIPRLYINEKINTGAKIPLASDASHYLTKVMRTDACLVFNDGTEFSATVSADAKLLIIGSQTDHVDPSNNITFCFAPIKRIDEMLNMVTQMGVARLQPVLTDRTVAHHINWGRIEKIIIEASEQSNRNTVPVLLPPIKFLDMNTVGLVFADERAAHGLNIVASDFGSVTAILIGPEGGFSDAEFTALDAAKCRGMSLGKTILRAEVAAVAALAKVV